MPEILRRVKKESDQIRELLGDNCAKKTSLLGSFVFNPNKLMKFEAQHEDEEIILLGRRHPITNLGWLTMASVAVFVPLFWGEFPFFAVLTDLTRMKITILWYLTVTFYVMLNSLLWFYNVYIVTDERLVDVDFVGLLNKTVNVADLDNLQDVNYSQNGLVASLFNIGDVVVETASEQKTPDASGELSAFTFEQISDPDKVAQVISQLMENEKEENR